MNGILCQNLELVGGDEQRQQRREVGRIAGDDGAREHFLAPRDAAECDEAPRRGRGLEVRGAVTDEREPAAPVLARELAQAAPGRRLTLCRELTKQFETVATMDTTALPLWLAGDANRLRGEFVVVLHATAQATSAADALPPAALQALRVLLER